MEQQNPKVKSPALAQENYKSYQTAAKQSQRSNSDFINKKIPRPRTNSPRHF
jgi:hypothetical protein